MSKEAIFSYKTIDNVNPRGKRGIFFTCHPDDFDKYFEIISEDILKIRDCAIYYTQDLNQDLSDDNATVDLQRMSLFVIPVTKKLLTENNIAIDHDLNFAKENHIPILHSASFHHPPLSFLNHLYIHQKAYHNISGKTLQTL